MTSDEVYTSSFQKIMMYKMAAQQKVNYWKMVHEHGLLPLAHEQYDET